MSWAGVAAGVVIYLVSCFLISSLAGAWIKSGMED